MLKDELNVLREIVGYTQAEKKKHLMEESGSDFSDQAGRVSARINELHPKRLELTVAQIIEETPSTQTLRMVAKHDYLPPFQAGQYINLFVDIDGVKTARPYAISSPPSQRAFYDLTIKRAQGGFVSHYLLDHVKVGDTLTSTGPMGSFHYNPLVHKQELVFFAGGSGIAPARSIAEDIIAKNRPVKMHIIYSNSYQDDIIFAEDMRNIAQNHPHIALTELVTRPNDNYSGLTGRITLARIQQWIKNPLQKSYFICGPTPFNEHIESLLKELGVSLGQIQVEANGPPKRPEKLNGWPKALPTTEMVTIRVKNKGQFSARVDEPLLNSLERNGYGAENACRSGECSLCRVKLISGKVLNPPESRLRKSDKKFGWIHSCVAFPLEDIEIEIC